MSARTQAHLVTGASDDGAHSSRPCRLERVLVTTVEAGKKIAIYDGASTSDTKVAEISVATLGAYEFELDMTVGLFTDCDATGTARVTIVRS